MTEIRGRARSEPASPAEVAAHAATPIDVPIEGATS